MSAPTVRDAAREMILEWHAYVRAAQNLPGPNRTAVNLAAVKLAAAMDAESADDPDVAVPS